MKIFGNCIFFFLENSKVCDLEKKKITLEMALDLSIYGIGLVVNIRSHEKN